MDSIINQTLKDIEIICIDDGSTDKSLEILKEYQQKDSRIQILTQKNLYAGVARNNGLKIAKGKYLSFLDSDDFFELNMLEEMYNQAEKDNSDIVICGWYNYDNISQKSLGACYINETFVKKSPFSPLEVRDDLYRICKSNPWTKLFKRDLFTENNLQFENCICCNDMTCVCTALALAKRISILNKPFIYYRMKQTTNLTANRHKHGDAVRYAVNKLENNLKKYGLYETFVNAFRFQANSSLHCAKNIKGKRKYF